MHRSKSPHKLLAHEIERKMSSNKTWGIEMGCSVSPAFEPKGRQHPRPNDAIFVDR